MTPQEAIELIESARKTMYLPKSKEYISDFGYALDMAINALEQQPCETIHSSTYGGVSWGGTYKPQQPCEDEYIEKYEAIRRIEVRRKITCESDPYNYEEWTKGYEEGIDDAIAMINSVPSITPKARWIPVSEKLPEEYIHVLCQFTLNGMGECYLAHGVFHVVGGLVMTCNEVIAWMPLPQPYKEESEDKK